MTSKSLRLLVLLPLFLVLFITEPTGSSPQRPLPNPVLYLTSAEPHQSGGKQFIRYRYDVFNKDAYPADFFAASPSLPPCGKNTKAARTWVDFYDQSGKRLQGFCAFEQACRPGQHLVCRRGGDRSTELGLHRTNRSPNQHQVQI